VAKLPSQNCCSLSRVYSSVSIVSRWSRCALLSKKHNEETATYRGVVLNNVLVIVCGVLSWWLETEPCQSGGPHRDPTFVPSTVRCQKYSYRVRAHWPITSLKNLCVNCGWLDTVGPHGPCTNTFGTVL
jgi:hypothetical protein